MGVDPEHDWKATYEILPGKEKVVDELRKLAEKSDQIYLATDLDREGEAIAWHLKETIGGDPESLSARRLQRNHAQSDSGSVRESDVDRRRVASVRSRRAASSTASSGSSCRRCCGRRSRADLSAGRVQSVAVRLIVEREREIRAFVPEEYWEAFADSEARERRRDLSVPGRSKIAARTTGRRSVEQSDEAMARLRGKPFTVAIARRSADDDTPRTHRSSRRRCSRRPARGCRSA